MRIHSFPTRRSSDLHQVAPFKHRAKVRKPLGKLIEEDTLENNSMNLILGKPGMNLKIVSGFTNPDNTMQYCKEYEDDILKNLLACEVMY